MTEIKKIKKLTPSELKKQNKKLNTVSKFNVAIEDELFEVTHDTVFRRTKQQRVIEDIIQYFDEANKNVELFELVTPYTSLLIIKHFTSLEIPDEIDEALSFMDVLIDLDIFNKIINQLPVDEITKIYDLLTEVVNNLKTNVEVAEQEAKALSEKVENPQVKEMLLNGITE